MIKGLGNRQRAARFINHKFNITYLLFPNYLESFFTENKGIIKKAICYRQMAL